MEPAALTQVPALLASPAALCQGLLATLRLRAWGWGVGPMPLLLLPQPSGPAPGLEESSLLRSTQNPLALSVPCGINIHPSSVCPFPKYLLSICYMHDTILNTKV